MGDNFEIWLVLGRFWIMLCHNTWRWKHASVSEVFPGKASSPQKQTRNASATNVQKTSKFSATSTTYVQKASPRCWILAALLHQPSTRAFHHQTPSSQFVKKNPRSLELLKFKKSEIAVAQIRILIYYSTFRQTNVSRSQSFRDQSRFNRFKVGLDISRTNADSQCNPAYNAFRRFCCCGNETIRQYYFKRDRDAANQRPALEQGCGSKHWALSAGKFFSWANLVHVPNVKN